MTVQQMRARMQKDGMDFGRYRNSLREQLLLQRVRARSHRPHSHHRRRTARGHPQRQEHRCRGVDEPGTSWFAYPEQTSDKEVAQLQAKAESIQKQAASGSSFLPSWPAKFG